MSSVKKPFSGRLDTLMLLLRHSHIEVLFIFRFVYICMVARVARDHTKHHHLPQLDECASFWTTFVAIADAKAAASAPMPTRHYVY